MPFRQRARVVTIFSSTHARTGATAMFAPGRLCCLLRHCSGMKFHGVVYQLPLVLNNIVLALWGKECFKEFHSLMKVTWQGRYETCLILLLEPRIPTWKDNLYHEGICVFHLSSYIFEYFLNQAFKSFWIINGKMIKIFTWLCVHIIKTLSHCLPMLTNAVNSQCT